ncbi:MAG: acetate--CoA ligase family protein [Desulfatiglandales bacterium]
MEVIEKALKEGRKTLSEYESKIVLSSYGIPVTREVLAHNLDELRKASAQIGYPFVLKGCSPVIAHKTEKGLILTDIRNEKEAGEGFEWIMARLDKKEGSVLVQEMVKGKRELVMGLTRDPQFGPCVMFGLGGIFTEVMQDVSFRVAPLERQDAMEMMDEIKAHKILEAVRGMEAADRDLLADMLINVGRIGLEVEEIKEIDINPVILAGSKAVAVDALVILS